MRHAGPVHTVFPLRKFKETLNVNATHYAGYRQGVLTALVAYRRRHFAGRDSLFEAGGAAFRPQAAHLNFFDSALYHELTDRPRTMRHLASSRVLTISVLGTLARREDLALLGDVPCADGEPALRAAEAEGLTLALQRPLAFLYERRRPDDADVWLESPRLSLVVAGRLLERDLGPCPEPWRGHCNGDYLHRPGRAPCWHSDHGARYWQYLPAVLGWAADRDHRPCPLRRPYGLVRSLLALASCPGRRQSLLLVHDARNPAFAPGRQIDRDLAALQATLRPPIALRRTTWQAIAAAMARSHWYADLLGWLRVKYGIEPE